MRVLIIEDDKKITDALQKFFEKAGDTIDCLGDGEAGQRRIELYKQAYDLVILDWMLPKRDGPEVCKNIREQGITTPILMLTVKDEIDDKVLGLNSGADDYLTKPFSLEELSARMKALLRRPEKSLPPKLKVRDLVLDPITRNVSCNGKEIKLTLKEFALLEYLMRNPNQVLNREQLFDHVWDFADQSFSNVVDVHLYHLRNKIKNSGGHMKFEVETIRGVGYRIIA